MFPLLKKTTPDAFLQSLECVTQLSANTLSVVTTSYKFRDLTPEEITSQLHTYESYIHTVNITYKESDELNTIFDPDEDRAHI